MSEEFVVRDRRLFGKDGQINPAAREETTSEETIEPAAGPEDQGQNQDQDQKPAEKAGQKEAGGSRALPPPSFPSLLVGLATSALIHLGESPESGPEEPLDLPAAKHAIDLLGILKTKTQGNLDSGEEALLETLLYDLRLKYVKASQ